MNGQFDTGDISPAKLFIGLSAALGLVIALIVDPPKTFFAHLIQWQLQTVGVVIVILVTHITLFSYLNIKLGNPWLRVVFSGVVGGLLFVPVALLSDLCFGGESLKDSFFVELINEMYGVLPPVVIAWITMNAPWLSGYRLNLAQQSAAMKQGYDNALKPDSKQMYFPSFLSQTKTTSANDILYIKSELHYLNVVTMNNRELILQSLKEVIAQLKEVGIDGMHCHRGYWVAKAAIQSVEKKGRQAVFTLKNDEKIPISRANVDKVLKWSNEN